LTFEAKEPEVRARRSENRKEEAAGGSRRTTIRRASLPQGGAAKSSANWVTGELPGEKAKVLRTLVTPQEHEGPTYRVDLLNLGLTRMGRLRAKSLFKFEHYPGKSLSSQGKKRSSRLFHFVPAGCVPKDHSRNLGGLVWDPVMITPSGNP